MMWEPSDGQNLRVWEVIVRWIFKFFHHGADLVPVGCLSVKNAFGVAEDCGHFLREQDRLKEVVSQGLLDGSQKQLSERKRCD